MRRITSKLNIMILLTMLMVGCTTSSTSTTQYPTTTRRLRHQRSNRSTHDQNERNFARNADLLRGWECGTPKPRVVYLSEAIDGEPSIPPNMVWPIKAAVLHRCEDMLGCCKDGKTCTPVESETVTITFKELDAHTAHTSYKHLNFTNHTRCSCT